MFPAADWTPTGQAAPPPPSGGRGGYPPATWPSRDQLEYTIKAITALLLVLALPWLAYKLLTDPGAVLEGAARQHIPRR